MWIVFLIIQDSSEQKRKLIEKTLWFIWECEIGPISLG